MVIDRGSHLHAIIGLFQTKGYRQCPLLTKKIQIDLKEFYYLKYVLNVKVC